MKGPTHRLIGASVAVGAAVVVDLPIVAEATAVGLAYTVGVWPDRLECRGLLQHRTTTHWLLTLTVLVVSAAVGLHGFVPVVPVAIGLAAGLLGHTLADACTPHGSPLFGPFYREPVRLLPRRLCIVTGSERERALAACVTVGLAAYCAWLAVELAMYCARLLGLT